MQNKGENIVCRLCLISCEYNYEDVEATTVEILRSLGLELDSDFQGKSVLCRICSDSAQKCFDFKTVCLCTEDCVNLFRTNGSYVKVDLREIYLQKNENEFVFASECYAICRLCMEVAGFGYYTTLNDDGKDAIAAKTILGKCFSEIDLDITENPIICTTCHESLCSYFSFIKNCLDMADKIKKYCKSEGSSSIPQVESNYVLQIKTEDKLNYESDYAGRDIQKNWCENELYDENKLKFEHLVQGRSQKMHIKHEFNENKEVDDSEVEKLNSSLQFTTTNMLYCENGYIDTNMVKKLHENEENVETELKCKSFMKAESHEFNVTYEDIDIKTEAEDTIRYQDDVLIPNDAAMITAYQSDECTIKMSDDNNLKQRTLIHKGPSEVAVHSCTICTYKTKQKGHLNEHMLKHKSVSEVMMYSCGICTFKTKYKSSYNTHMILHKNDSEVRMYSCGICTYKTKFKGNLKQHTLIHKDVFELTTYSCEICTYNTKRKRSLNQHMLIHKNASEITMYSCEICTFKTKRKHNLKKHMSIHRNVSEVSTHSSEDSISYPLHTPPIVVPLYVPPIVVYIN